MPGAGGDKRAFLSWTRRTEWGTNRGATLMPMILDHQLRERIPHNGAAFPITFFVMSW